MVTPDFSFEDMSESNEGILSREGNMQQGFGDTDVEQRITRLLQGGESDRNEAFQLIHDHFRHALCAAARRYNRSMDLESLWGDALAWFCSHSQAMAYDAS